MSERKTREREREMKAEASEYLSFINSCLVTHIYSRTCDCVSTKGEREAPVQQPERGDAAGETERKAKIS